MPLAEHLARLRVARRRAVLQVAAPLRLPRFQGALWHAVVGRALKHLVCTVPPGLCVPCPRRAGCPYPRLVEGYAEPGASGPLAPGARVPGALVFDPGAWASAQVTPGEPVALDYALLGRPELAPVVDEAVALAAREGLGRARVPARVVRVEAREGAVAGAAEAAAAMAPGGLRLELLTPLRLKARGRYLRALDLGALARDLMFRVSLLGHHLGGLPWPAPWPEVGEEARRARVARARLRWVEGVRYSARQGREIVMGGLLGVMELQDVGPHLARLLGAGTVLHAGKGAAVGLGQYRLAAPGQATSARGERACIAEEDATTGGGPPGTR
jgi:hypothetical protein